jgi:translation initiation factor 5
MEQNNKLYLTSDPCVLLDLNYRYKISGIEISRVVKKGTKITVLPNMETFAKELEFDPNKLIRILGKSLSCKNGIDKTTKEYYLQGDYSDKEIKSKLYDFIQKCLLCASCDTPEVDLKCSNEKIKQKCRACGAKNSLDFLDDSIVTILK